MRFFLSTLLLFASHYSQAQTEIISTLDLQWSNNVYFQLGSATLTSSAKHTIDSLFYNDVLVKGRMVGIIGYTDNIGGEEGNKSLSVKRASAVAAYLRYMGIDSMYIEQITGMGEIRRADNAGGYPLDRRVSIIPGGFLKADKVEWTDSGTLVATLHYKFGTTDLKPESAMLLDTVLQILKKNPRMKVGCDGYVCCHLFKSYSKNEIAVTGLPEMEFRTHEADEMSKQRAIRTYLYLKTNGIDSTRLRFAGHGFRKNLIVNGKREHGKDRVEIRTISKQ